MLTLYRPGDGLLHRMPAGPKMLLLAVVAVGLAALPTAAWVAAVCGVAVLLAYVVSGIGVRELGRQAWGLRWILAITVIGQLVFLGPEPALANTARVAAALLVAALLPLTTRVDDMLDALERGLGPLRRIGVDAERAALLLAVTITTIPVLARLAAEVREAQRARGARPSLRAGIIPFVVLSLRHADQLGEALAARGVR
ncbi:energy-coupling factor transporter transmembrane component T family protein [Microbacterium sp. IEGM 1404]|uniref:energy-coupling factor transporter transmembrane component T family protein n=1 Tax=Microbacterium sp. IEGM 1404 TaxID=3047084 RepID=UPI0024B704A3|nr:energy-coupling factor transporter transmembrane protein EcfT [Microbacterium sp. IEGM 1404]MDI9891299.1 energy-coupling factor transporter transmembrane protein EcfT [Microbacterium sp. IEGM 1404]